MKKIFSLVFGLTLLVSSASFAQYQKGDKLLNLGIGLGSNYAGGTPIGASFEYGITDDISVGAQIDYYSYTYNYGFAGSAYNFKYTFIPVAVRGSYHLNKVLNLSIDKLDLYGGVALGYYISSYSDNTGYSGTYTNNYGNKTLFGIFAGGRYYFSPKIGAFAELGYSVSTLKIGVAFKL